MNQPAFFERLNLWIRDSVTVKLVSTGFIALILLIPAAMITDLIRERSSTHEDAAKEISASWGKAQVITGPVIIVPYRAAQRAGYAYFLPDTLRVSGAVTPEVRYRGIYETVVYSADLEFSGQFTPPDFSAWSVDPEAILWNEAVVAVGIADMHGIQERITLQWNSEAFDFDPGVQGDPALATGVSTRVPVQDAGQFRFNLQLNGSDTLQFVPVGEETHVALRSPWSTPSFSGAFLPDNRALSSDGFTAEWLVLHLNRPYPQAWRGTTTGLAESAFGVRLLLPVDHYRKSLRAATYAVLVIALTFLTFFLSEVLLRKRAHPFQYVLVGLALCLFYSLLLALSEHIPFNGAYAIATCATVVAVTGYLRSVFGNHSYLVGAILVVVYGFMFLLLQLEQLALLIGTMGLFVALAITMYFSRGIQWFGPD